MPYDFGYAEETQLGKTYDLKLITRLIPFIRPYIWWMAGSIVLVILLAGLDLSLPYVTKLAIDRNIVPRISGNSAGSASAGQQTGHWLRFDLTEADVQAVVQRFPQIFRVEANQAMITHEDLKGLPPSDRLLLRKKDLSGLAWITLAFMLLVLISFGLNFVQTVIMEYAGQVVMHDLRCKLFDHIQSLSLDFFNHNPIARLVTRVTNDIGNMHELFTSVISLIFKDLFLMLGIAGVLLALNLHLALICFSVLPFVIFFALFFSRQIRDVYRKLRVKVAEINTRFSETIAGMRVIQAFGQELRNRSFFESLNHENYLLGMRQIHVFALFMPVIEVLGTLTVAFLIYFGGGHVIARNISLGELVAFLSYMKMFFGPIRDLAEKYNILQDALASAERIFLLLDNRQKVPEPEKAKASDLRWPGSMQSLVFENVTFGYLADEIILKDVSFTLTAGKTLAVVGPTGSGKTSLINLLVRFYDPGSGRILLDGQDIRSISTANLRSGLALVSQDPFLFSGSIRDNIFLDRQDVDSDRIGRVLAASNCYPLIERLPQGIDTIMTEGGATLSSGERQLISIARAFARDPQLIILDEATSYIDSETESQLQEALANLMTGRTAIIIAHRLSTARTADCILVLNRGRIVESGSHVELMQRMGFYFHLNRIQNSAGLPSDRWQPNQGPTPLPIRT
jgi:ATP-binding cassette subfamily B protein